MDDNRNADLVDRYFSAVAANDFETLARLRAPDWIEDWPQSGERIRGHDRYRAIHERYPGGFPDIEVERLVGAEDRWVMTPSMTVQRVIGSGDVWVAEGLNQYGDGSSARIVAIIELRDGLVRRQHTYFAAPFEAPAWRADWVEPIALED
jgi:ketosteroid isomerase-like protein